MASRSRTVVGLVVTLGALASPAAGQDVTGIANADIRDGYRSFSGRFGHLLADDGRPAASAAQLNYQHNLNGKWSVQAAALFARIDGGAVELRGAQTQIQWQFAEDEAAGFDGALNLVARIPDGDDGPGRVAPVLVGKWTKTDWEARAILAFPIEVGERARDGVGIVQRAEVTRRLGEIGRLGLQTSINFNTTARFGGFEEQNHQAGPVFKLPVGRLMATFVALGGVSRAAPDLETKVFLTLEL